MVDGIGELAVLERDHGERWHALQAGACRHSQIKLDLAVQSSVLGAVEFKAVHVLFRHRGAASSGSGVMAVTGVSAHDSPRRVRRLTVDEQLPRRNRKRSYRRRDSSRHGEAIRADQRSV